MVVQSINGFPIWVQFILGAHVACSLTLIPWAWDCLGSVDHDHARKSHTKKARLEAELQEVNNELQAICA